MNQLPLPLPRPSGPANLVPLVAGRTRLLIEYVRVRRARHYIARVNDDGRVRVTVPWGGSRREAERFVRERIEWIERERFRRLSRPRGPAAWHPGTLVPVGGEMWPLAVEPAEGSRARICFGPHAIPVTAEDALGDLRRPVDRYLRALAARELPARLDALAREHGFRVARVSIRNQRSRWGACSPAGHITLNWRLVQLPARVRDYVMLHELVHLRHLDHSRRFWTELERLCPDCRAIRTWLKSQRLSE